ncbi:outer membrane protein assembly factor BamB family protein [Aeoliella mucimassa]|uniref:Outer membrane biogenesis protein BamB n=1 Tax=Aeoliella mucimassa TaxID=2527972 RepID=A0A518AMZ1_9BACT|nr:PQQ-binding-like beta-propeller repeat protein [Aeoliella mucimassa]QDU56066.1 outer membrane biogenesis protein BamB [Aeoliella mucimassa]
MVAINGVPVTVIAQVVPAQDAGDEVAEEPEEASDLHSLYYSAHLPTNRRLSQDLRQAKQLIDAGRYSEALPLIDRVLEAEEDNFELASSRGADDVVQGLKQYVQKLLSELPPAGVAALELDQGVKARRELDAAVSAGEIAELARIARRYPMTEAAVEARLMLAQMNLDKGHYDTAAGVYEQLLGWSKAAQRYSPLIAARLAWCNAAMGNTQGLNRSIERLRAMKSPSERAELARLLGTDNTENWLTELKTYAAQPSRLPMPAGWLVDGRSASRNPLVNVSPVPHLWPAWEARTVKETNVAERLQSRVDWQHRHGAAWGLVSSPVAVGNHVVIRTPTNLVAIDWQTGRRVWETRPDSVEDDKNTIQLQYQSNNNQSIVALDATDQRLWLDSVYGAISSDGQRVYAIRNLESINMRSANRYRVQGLFRTGQEFEEPGNTLTAFDLRTEGKRVWEINGENNKELTGCFFLGPPLAEGDSLFVIAEFVNSIHLIQLNARTGELEWKQPLANLERSVLLDVGRRLAGATPTLAGGLVLCPTGAGSVVAVDPIDRSLRWVFRFEVDESVANRNNLRQTFGVYQPRLTTGWQRNRVLVTDGSVLITAPECEDLYCLDLYTGEKQWSLERGSLTQLVGVADETVVLAGGTQFSLVELESGKPASGESDIKLPEEVAIAGTALLSKGEVVAPLSNSQVVVIDLSKREIAYTLDLRECDAIGNLAYHRGSILSQSATTLTKFDRLELLEEQLAAAEADNQVTAESLRIGGELAWANDELDQAIQLLQESYRMTPNDPLIRHRLTSALVEAMRADYTRFGSYTQLLEELSTDTRQRLELYRFSTDGALAAGDATAAFAFLREIYAIDLDDMVDLGPEHTVQSERWFAERLSRVWHLADEALQQDISDEIHRLDLQAKSDELMQQSSRLVRYFGAIPAGRDIRIHLASEWSKVGRLAEAELIMLSPELEERNAQWSAPDALAIAAVPGNNSPDYDPHNWLGSNLRDYYSWPDGQVTSDITNGRATPVTSTNSVPYNRGRNTPTLRTEVSSQTCGVELAGPNLLAIAHAGVPQLFAWNPLGELTHGVPLPMAGLQNSNSTEELRSIRFGHFIVLGLNNEVATIDLRPNPGEQGMRLWATDPDPRMRAQTLRMIQLQNRGLVQGAFIPSQADMNTESNSPSGELCHASPLGVVLRKDDQVSCYNPADGQLVWSRQGLPTGGTCFGDSHHLLMQAEGEIEGVVISMIDGSTIGEWRSPEGKRQLTVGRNLVVSLYKSGHRQIQVIDTLTSEVLVEREYSSTTKVASFASKLLAAMDSEGHLEVIDCESGSVLFERDLEPEQGLESIHPLLCGDLLVVGTNSKSAAEYNTAGNRPMDNAPLLTGHVYALDPTTGEPRWSQPATVKGQGLWMLQPTGSPVLVFVSRYADDNTSNQSGNTHLLCLDKRTGRSLFRDNGLREVQNQPMAMRINHGKVPAVEIDLRQSQVTLEFTDAPRAPEPVALAEVEGAQKSLSAGIFGLLRRSLGGSLNDSPSGDVDVDD